MKTPLKVFKEFFKVWLAAALIVLAVLAVCALVGYLGVRTPDLVPKLLFRITIWAQYFMILIFPLCMGFSAVLKMSDVLAEKEMRSRTIEGILMFLAFLLNTAVVLAIVVCVWCVTCFRVSMSFM